MSTQFLDMPDDKGYFGEYGGQIIPPELKAIMDEINDSYEQVRNTKEFRDELYDLQVNYVGRPSPIYYAKRISEKVGGARIFLKREDLNHTGAHKINHCIGEALLAKHMGKTKVLAETGAGQHGVALATACAFAVSHAMKIAKDMPKDNTILVNLSGRGDKDADFVADHLSL